MTVQNYMADRIAGAGRLLAHFLETTEADKRDWIPDVPSAASLRSANQQVAECVLVNRLMANLLLGGPAPTGNPMEKELTFADIDDAKTQLIASADALADAIRGLSDDDLARDYTTRRGVMPGYNVIELPYRNMQYHGGQLNLLQLLYGDTVFHVPGR